MRWPLFILTLASLSFGEEGLCANQKVDWVVVIGTTKNLVRNAHMAAYEFFTLLLKDKDVIDHRVTVVDYTDAEGGCISYITPPTPLGTKLLTTYDAYKPKEKSTKTWNMAGFDGITRPLIVQDEKYKLPDDSKKIILYFYDTPSLMTDNYKLKQQINGPSDGCSDTAYVGYDEIQELVQQRDATVIAIKITSSSDQNKSHLDEELEQFEELRRRGLKLRRLTYTSYLDYEMIATNIYNTVLDECTPRALAFAEQLRLSQVLNQCRKLIDWTIVYPTTATGLSWVQNIAGAIQAMANDLGVIDEWAIAAVKYTDKKQREFGNSNWAHCAVIQHPVTPVRHFQMIDLRSDIKHDKGDAPHSGLDAVARALINKRMKYRVYAQRVVIYVHDAPSHVADDSGLLRMTTDEWKDIQDGVIDAHCHDREFVSYDKVAELLKETSSILIDVSVPPGDGGFGLEQYLALTKLNIKATRLDVSYYAGDRSIYDDLVGAMLPFCQ